jgi:large conductance mechanosensitive channel
VIKGFRDFILRGNVVDLAVAVIIATAFGTVVASFTSSFIEPLINLALGGGVQGGTFTVDEQEFTVGAFLNTVIFFLITAAVVYFAVVLPVQKLLTMRKAGEVAEVAATPEDIALLQEIRDLLRDRPTV